MPRHAAPFTRSWPALRPAMLATILIAALILGGCATVSAPPPGAVPSATAPSHQQATGKAAAVVRTARSLVGAPYAWGGYSPATGFDCSGLVWYTYHQNGVSLPRMSWQQFGAGSPVAADQLHPGDLIFHQVETKGKSLHVGIVTDRGTFVHAPSSGKPVMESALFDTFWGKHFIGARRVLETEK
ncbi:MULTISPECIES: C40 family peptidase [Pseudodesulfovibrio]|uniref:NLP/P60 protein n=1 Tax=Pseudodesulfovibrio aespoeensis (strain ATCC 700646 / DSM 10631 / Aspo-2) TaxID=643562 RepID=E6VYS2_PSEA9|nr:MULTISPECIES: C40 family peptidase [Pseudodesulfovibrio]ADU63939.1 NLP/P60 protein [Pseudodesulfovibrio aespoeensis Aspo-2]